MNRRIAAGAMKCSQSSLGVVQVAAVAALLLSSFLLLASPVTGVGKFLYQDDPDPNAKAVIEVTESTGFFQTSKTNRIVEFYSPYCGHCISFKTKYMKVAAAARQKYGYDQLEFYAVSCAGVPDLCQRLNIQAYPSVFAIAASDASAVSSSSNSTFEVDSMQTFGSTTFFSVGKVEKALKLTETTTTTSAKRKLEGKEEGDEEEPEVKEEEEEDVDPADDTTKNEEDVDVEDNGETPDDEDEKVEKEDALAGTNMNIGIYDGERKDLLVEPVNDDQQEEESPDAEYNNWKFMIADAAHIPKHPSRAAGADAAKDKPRTMDQWKEIQKQRLREKENKWLRQKKVMPGSLGTEISKNPAGATAIMLANRQGTEEFSERQKDIFNFIDRMQTSAQRKNGGIIESVKRGQLPFKKQVTSPKFVENLPIVKRVVRMTSEEELILDASLSFLEGLRVGVFRSSHPLSPKQKRALKDWLELLSISLPLEWALHETIGDLSENIDQISKSARDLYDNLEKHPFPRTKWSKSCSQNNGFTCGFWKLLHIMTVGIAEHRGGLDLIDPGSFRRNNRRVFSPAEAADTLREYMAHFFPCTECANHFIAQYDQCEMNRRCDRLTLDKGPSASDADWKELAKWLWEFHNSVNVQVLNHRLDDKRKHQQRSAFFKVAAGPGGATMTEQVQVVWPTLDDCVVCFNVEDGSFNEDAVFLHLERTYWPGNDLKDTPRKLIWFEDDGQGAIGLNSILFVIGLIIVLILQNRVARASVAQTMLRAQAMGARVAAGKKVRTF